MLEFLDDLQYPLFFKKKNGAGQEFIMGENRYRQAARRGIAISVGGRAWE